jgi:hypothetical protein
MMFMFLHFPNFSRIKEPLVAAHDPFSIMATVRFWILCAARSESSSSIATKIPAL